MLTHCEEYCKSRQIDRDQLLERIRQSSAYPLPPMNSPYSYSQPQATPGVWNPSQPLDFSYTQPQHFANSGTYPPANAPQFNTFHSATPVDYPSSNVPQYAPHPGQNGNGYVTPGLWNPNPPPQ